LKVYKNRRSHYASVIGRRRFVEILG